MNINDGVSSSDLNEFVLRYEEIKNLKEKYELGKENRKELANEIIDKVNNMFDLMEIFKMDLYSKRSKYIFTNYISDYYIILYALLKIANTGENEYNLKKLKTCDANEKGNIWLIGDKDVLNSINEKEYINAKRLQKMITGIIYNGYSMVMITNFDCQWNVLPVEKEIEDASIKKFKVDAFSNLCCYTYNDELGLAVDKLSKYIETYGGDIDGISIDTIVSRIDNINNEKILSKTRK